MNTPLMHSNEIELIERYLDQDTTMLEYGSGASTAYFAEKVKHLTSIEHNQRWVKVVENKIQNLSNVEYVVIPTTNVKPAPKDLFAKYIDWPKTQNRKFDVVFIDGRARQWVAESVQNVIDETSIVLVHDWGPIVDGSGMKRPRYDRILDFYDVVDQAGTLVALKKK